MDARIDSYADQIDAAVEEDPDLDHAQWRAEIEQLREDVAGWRERLEADL